MANKGSILRYGDRLIPGDWLSSPNGLFCAYLHSDANLCVYYGQKPDSKLKRWESHSKGNTSRSI